MKDKCTVYNKSAGHVVYRLPELGLRRQFYPREVKKDISVNELEKLAQTPGGRKLILNYLMVDDKEILEYLINGRVEPEYWIKEEEIDNWMSTCSLDEFKDALDFAPEGTKDLIKAHAVSLPLNDMSKRVALKEQLGFDVSKALDLTVDEEKKEEVKPTRRVQTTTESDAPKRRITISE